MATTARARTARTVVPLKRRRERRATLHALVPSGRAIALLFAGLGITVGLYFLARESSLFAIKTVEVKGAPPALTRKIDVAVAPFRGHSLVGLDRSAIARAVLGIPEVRTVKIDRDFPNTVRVFVGRESPVAILRRGSEAWLIAASNKVVRPFPLGRSTDFPRIWVTGSVAVAQGAAIDDSGVKTAIELLASFGRAGRGLQLANVIASDVDLTLVTSSGIQLRFGDASQAALKLVVVEEILPKLGLPPAGSVAYLDVSVPSRPVSGTTLKSKVEG